MPKVQFEARKKWNKGMYCPSGHENGFMTVEEVKAQNDAENSLPKVKEQLQECRRELTETKGMLVTLRHRAEQAEALVGIKAPEIDAPMVEQQPSAEICAGSHDAAKPLASKLVIREQDGRLMCPLCWNDFAHIGWVRRHIRQTHPSKSEVATLLSDPANYTIAPLETKKTSTG
jgi:hypothetical protein